MRLSGARGLGIAVAALAGVLLFACTPARTGTDAGPATAEETLASAREAMAAQRGFRGGPASSPAEPGPDFTYAAPDRMLLKNLGGDFQSHMLLIGNEVFASYDGLRWLTSPETGAGFGAFFRLWYDPRAVLAHALDPEAAGEETIEGRRYRIVRVRLDGEGFAASAPAPEPYTRLSLTITYPEGADGRALERLGYQVFDVQGEDFAVWEVFKGPYYLSINEQAHRPGEPRSQWEVWISAVVEGVATLEPDGERELRAALEAYGADPALLAEARVTPVKFDPGKSLAPVVEDVRARLWIDVETGVVRRMALGMSEKSEEAVVEFRDYGTDISLERPEAVLPFNKANALEQATRGSFVTLDRAAQAYRARNGRYPESLTPEALAGELAELGRQWPTNPFSGGPVGSTADSPGDFQYALQGDGYELSVYGWDHMLGSKLRTPPSEATETPADDPVP